MPVDRPVADLMRAWVKRLSDQTLVALSAPRSATPSYDRAAVTPGIVHLGVGAFHRAHQAVYVDDCLGAGETGWGIVGASLRSSGHARCAWRRRTGSTRLAVRSSDGESLRVVGSIVSLLVAPEDPAALLDAMTDPRIRIVTLTITEKAYLRNAAGDLDAAHPDIAADLANPGAPQDRARLSRRGAGAPPRGRNAAVHDPLLRQPSRQRRDAAPAAARSSPRCATRILPRTSRRSGVARRAWSTASCRPPPMPTARGSRGQLGVEDAWPVMTEPFRQWVIEDDFPAGRPDWEKFGVDHGARRQALRGDEAAGCSTARIRRSPISACSPATKRWPTAFADPAIRRFVDGLWAEAIPTLPKDAGLDPQSYIGELAERFANTALAASHRADRQ